MSGGTFMQSLSIILGDPRQCLRYILGNLALVVAV